MRKRTTMALSFIALIMFVLVMWKDFNISSSIAKNVETAQKEEKHEELENETEGKAEELTVKSQEAEKTEEATDESAMVQESQEEASEVQDESYEAETYEVEAYKDENYEPEYEVEAEPQPEPEPEPQPDPEPEVEIENYSYGGDVLNAYVGVVDGPSGRETYYNLPMEGVIDIMRGCGYDEANYPYWVRGDGVKMLGGYVMCAANLDIRPRGTILESSLGTAIVCDTGAFAYSDPYQLDIAVDW